MLKKLLYIKYIMDFLGKPLDNRYYYLSEIETEYLKRELKQDTIPDKLYGINIYGYK